MVVEKNEISFGNNNLGTKDLFDERSVFETDIWPTDDPKPLDVNKDFPNYGKVDNNGNCLFLGGLSGQAGINVASKIEEKKGTIVTALDFVAEAYENFRINYKNESLLNPNFDSTEKNPLSALKAKTGWIGTNSLYHDHMQIIFSKFGSKFLKEKGRWEKMVSFENFLKLWMEAASQIIIGEMPITRTAFIKSPLCPIATSGLVIEIDRADHSDDRIKIEYLENTNFGVYRAMANAHGFLIDKQAPWRLIANVSSKYMLGLLAKRGVSPPTVDKMFETYYYRSHHLDISDLKIRLFEYYKDYVAAFPVFLETKLQKGKSFTCNVYRRSITWKGMEEQYSPKFWLRLYLYLRAKEEKINMSQIQFERKVNKANKISIHKGQTHAVDYINAEVRKFFIRDIEGEGLGVPEFIF